MVSPYPDLCGPLEEAGSADSLCPNVSSAIGNVGAPRPSPLGFGHHQGVVFQWREGFWPLQDPFPEPSQASWDPPQGSYLKSCISFNVSVSILPAVALRQRPTSTLSPPVFPSHKNTDNSLQGQGNPLLQSMAALSRGGEYFMNDICSSHWPPTTAEQ